MLYVHLFDGGTWCVALARHSSSFARCAHPPKHTHTHTPPHARTRTHTRTHTHTHTHPWSPHTTGGKLRVLTHCNTGSLATAGWGTALGVIRTLHERGLLEHAYCTETRPYNQGESCDAFG